MATDSGSDTPKRCRLGNRIHRRLRASSPRRLEPGAIGTRMACSGNDFTELEPKEAFCERGLTTSGLKTEFIQWLESDDEWEVWQEPGTARQRNVQRATDLINFEDVSRPTYEGRTVEEERDDAMRELVFLRQERKDWKRELQLLRQELAILKNSLAMTSATGDSCNNSMSRGVKELKKLLPEFDGTNDTLWKWRDQLLLLRQTYQLSESSTRILISSRLKGRALVWFNSRPEYLTLSVEELLKEMEEIFDLRPRKLMMRKQFESRIWNRGESFSDYYHDKMILASSVQIAENEIVNYLIEGMMDQGFQNLARLMNFRTDAELLWFFENDQLDYKRASEVKMRKDAVKTVGGGKQELLLPRMGPARCYRCHETGHDETQCQRAPARRNCHVWGSMEQWARECPRQDQPSTSGTSRDSARVVSTNVVQPIWYPKPYMIPVKIAIENANRESCKYVVEALVDSGSPISLVRSDAIQVESQLFIKENVPQVYGINSSQLRIDGAFYGILEISGVLIKIKFYAVPSETMSCNVLLGRDFLNCPQLCFTFGETFKVTRVKGRAR